MTSFLSLPEITIIKIFSLLSEEEKINLIIAYKELNYLLKNNIYDIFLNKKFQTFNSFRNSNYNIEFINFNIIIYVYPSFQGEYNYEFKIKDEKENFHKVERQILYNICCDGKYLIYMKKNQFNIYYMVNIETREVTYHKIFNIKFIRLTSKHLYVVYNEHNIYIKSEKEINIQVNTKYIKNFEVNKNNIVCFICENKEHKYELNLYHEKHIETLYKGICNTVKIDDENRIFLYVKIEDAIIIFNGMNGKIEQRITIKNFSIYHIIDSSLNLIYYINKNELYVYFLSSDKILKVEEKIYSSSKNKICNMGINEKHNLFIAGSGVLIKF